jgi:hypothetical protein
LVTVIPRCLEQARSIGSTPTAKLEMISTLGRLSISARLAPSGADVAIARIFDATSFASASLSFAWS